MGTKQMSKAVKFFVFFFVLLALLILACLCFDKRVDKNTLLIYICGSTLETYSGYASNNIEEMLKAKISPNTTVILEVGGSKRWENSSISAEHIERYTIKNGKLVLLEQLEQSNMGSAETLESFINFGVSFAPTNQLSIIFWDHGGGSIDGVCADANYDYDSLTLPEIKTAFENTASLMSEKWEFVGFDACLMATYDMACLLEPYAKYMIASEEIESSSGWDYKTVLSKVGTKTFYSDTLKSYATKQAKKATYTLSVTNLSKLYNADLVIEKIADQINYDISYIGKALSKGKEFGVKKNDSNGTNLFDLGLIANVLEIEYDFTSMINLVNGSAHKDATGMSIYFPIEQESLLDEYREVCQNPTYIQFLTNYFKYEPQIAIEFDNKGYDNNGCLSFSLTAISNKYVQAVGYELHSAVANEDTQKMYCIGKDNDVSFDNNVYTVNFQGNWVYINDILLHCEVYEKKDTYTVFSAPVKINGELCYLLFTYFKSNQSISVDGFVIAGDIASRIHDLVRGMNLTILYKDLLDNGEESYYEEGTITWDDNAKLSVKKLCAGEYQYIPYVIDIYGNVYHGHTAFVYFDGEKNTVQSIAAG